LIISFSGTVFRTVFPVVAALLGHAAAHAAVAFMLDDYVAYRKKCSDAYGDYQYYF